MLLHRIRIVTIAGSLFLFAGISSAAEIDLKSLQPLETAKKKNKNGAYVGVFLGQSTSTSANMQLNYVGHSLDYDVADRDGDLLAGFEVGYQWRSKYPINLGLEFEAFYGSTEINASPANALNAGTPIDLGDVATASTDLNYVAFMINGTIGLDLRKYQPHIGKWIPKFKPYVGGGIGGAQLWYRNQRVQSFGDLLALPTASSATAFGIDEFVFAYQIFGGLEFKINEKLGIYGEYRRLTFDKTNELTDLEINTVLGGLKLQY